MSTTIDKFVKYLRDDASERQTSISIERQTKDVTKNQVKVATELSLIAWLENPSKAKDCRVYATAFGKISDLILASKLSDGEKAEIMMKIFKRNIDGDILTVEADKGIIDRTSVGYIKIATDFRKRRTVNITSLVNIYKEILFKPNNQGASSLDGNVFDVLRFKYYHAILKKSYFNKKSQLTRSDLIILYNVLVNFGVRKEMIVLILKLLKTKLMQKVSTEPPIRDTNKPQDENPPCPMTEAMLSAIEIRDKHHRYMEHKSFDAKSTETSISNVIDDYARALELEIDENVCVNYANRAYNFYAAKTNIKDCFIKSIESLYDKISDYDAMHLSVFSKSITNIKGIEDDICFFISMVEFLANEENRLKQLKNGQNQAQEFSQ